MYLQSVPRETAWLYAIYENKPMNYFPPIIFFEKKKPKPKSNWFFSENLLNFKEKKYMTLQKKSDYDVKGSVR